MYGCLDVHILVCVRVCVCVCMCVCVSVCFCEPLQFDKIRARGLRPIIVQEKISLDGLDLRSVNSISLAKANTKQNELILGHGYEIRFKRSMYT